MRFDLAFEDFRKFLWALAQSYQKVLSGDDRSDDDAMSTEENAQQNADDEEAGQEEGIIGGKSDSKQEKD